MKMTGMLVVLLEVKICRFVPPRVLKSKIPTIRIIAVHFRVLSRIIMTESKFTTWFKIGTS